MNDAIVTVPRFTGRNVDSEFQLVAISGPAGALTVNLDASVPSRVLVGQGPLCEIRIPDPTTSRRHAAIEIRGTHLTLSDLGSTNGTFVNGVRILAAELHGGEVIRVGDTKLRVFASAVTASSRLLVETIAFGRVIGASVEMRRCFAIAHRLASTDAPILLEGEPGTGKRLLAEAIHEASARATGPFVVLDTAGVDPARIHDALFGRGREALGLLEAAEGGTLVIEEVAALDMPSQLRLRRALEHAEIRRKDGAVSRLDVRVIACTRKDLDREVQAERFREDLLDRLSARLEVPPLRRRDGDLPLLIDALWTALGGAREHAPHHLVDALADHSWPGNVRELESVLVRTLVANEEEPAVLRSRKAPIEDTVEAVLALDLPLPRARERIVQEFERRYLERVLARHDGNVLRAAAAAGVARRYFQLLRAKQRGGPGTPGST